MAREFNFLRHIGIFFLTILIFSVGVFIGGDIEQLRVQNLYTQLQEEDLQYQQILTERTYINHLIQKGGTENKEFCPLVVGAYQTSLQSLEDSRIRLENYLEDPNSEQVESFERLRAHYANLQIEYFVLAEEIDELCRGSFHTILYFFSDDDERCEACQDQGIHLGYVKQRLQDEVLIFSFEESLEGPVQLLVQEHDVSLRGLPVLIIDGEIHGFLDNKDLLEILESSE